jgi:hypothetical protein
LSRRQLCSLALTLDPELDPRRGSIILAQAAMKSMWAVLRHQPCGQEDGRSEPSKATSRRWNMRIARPTPNAARALAPRRLARARRGVGGRAHVRTSSTRARLRGPAHRIRGTSGRRRPASPA